MFVDTKPEMSDRQYATAERVIGRSGDSAVRFRDCSVSTLIAMAKPARGWAELRFDWDGNTRYVSHAELTAKGRKVFERERIRREAALAHERTIERVVAMTAQGPAADAATTARARSIIAAADPFKVVATGRPARPAVHPDSPYFDEIPF